MDYVEFVERVMESSAAHWRDAGPTEQMVGVELQEIENKLPASTTLSANERLLALHETLLDLEDMGLVELPTQRTVRLSQEGRKFPDASFQSAWPSIFRIFIDEDQTRFLTEVVELSMTEADEYSMVRWVDLEDVEAAFGRNWDRDAILRTSSIARSLHELGLARFRGVLGGGTIRPTYAGVVRTTRIEPTESYELISRLVVEGETTNVDFKRELNLKRDREKAEFVRDILALGNTKSSGERFLLIGLDDEGEPHESPVDGAITQERLEQILQSYAEPWPTIRYRSTQWQATTVGIVQVSREPQKIPYLPTRTLSKLVEGEVYVRHGSHTEPATPAERESLIAEGKRARGET